MSSSPFMPKIGMVPAGSLWRVRDLLSHIHVSIETFKLWKKAGLKTIQPGTSAEFVFADVLFEFLQSEPDLPRREPPKAKKIDRKESR